MDKRQQAIFISELIDSVKEKILWDLDKMPDGWNGVELRQLVADRFSDNTVLMGKTRRSAYENDKEINNL